MTGATDSTRENGPAWEYKILRTTDGGLFSGDTAPMEETLDTLGGEGWELVDTISDSRGSGAGSGQTALVFKRPNPDEPPNPER